MRSPAPVLMSIVPVKLMPALLLILKLMVLVSVPNVTDWATVPLNSIRLPVEVPLSVMVPPD